MTNKTWNSIDFGSFVRDLKNYHSYMTKFIQDEVSYADQVYMIGGAKGLDPSKSPQKSFNESAFWNNRIKAYEKLTPLQNEISHLKKRLDNIDELVNTFSLIDQESLYDIINGLTFKAIADDRGFKAAQDLRRHLEKEFKKG